MSISSILSLTPVAATSVVETASNVTISHHVTEQADALNATEGGDSIVELSNLALLQNTQQLEVQKQIIATNNAQQNAIKHLENIAASTTANNNQHVNAENAQTALNSTDALLNAHLQTALNNEALLGAISTENASNVLANAINHEVVPVALLTETTNNTTATPTATSTVIGNISNTVFDAAQSVEAQATPIANPTPSLVDEAAFATTNLTNFAAEAGTNPAVAAAIAAYQLSTGMITDRGDKVPDKSTDEEVSVKSVTMSDAIDKIKDDDAKERAKREMPWVWKRVLKIKKTLMRG